MLRTMAAGAVLVLMSVSGPAFAQAAPSCTDDRGKERCTADARAAQRALYDLPPIETYAAEGALVRRAFIVDGYGRDQVAISVERTPGKDPLVRVRARRPGAAARGFAEMTAPVPGRVWDELVEAGERFDRDLAPKAEGDDVAICLHGWLTTVEVSDAGGKVRARTHDACDEGLAWDYAFLLSRRAVELLAPCQALDPRHYRNAPMVLVACSTLEGDRIAAAAVLNAYNEAGFDSPSDARHAALAEGAFRSEARVSLGSDAAVVGWEKARTAWFAHIARHEDFELRVEKVVGESATRAVVIGRASAKASRSGPDEAPRYMSADFRMTWVMDETAGEVQEITIGEFRPAKD